MIIGGPAYLSMPGWKSKIELQAFEFGYSLGEAGIPLESPEGLKLTGRFTTELIIEGLAMFLVGRFLTSVLTDNDLCLALDPEQQEAVREIRQEVYERVVRSGIKALFEENIMCQ